MSEEIEEINEELKEELKKEQAKNRRLADQFVLDAIADLKNMQKEHIEKMEPFMTMVTVHDVVVKDVVERRKHFVTWVSIGLTAAAMAIAGMVTYINISITVAVAKAIETIHKGVH